MKTGNGLRLYGKLGLMGIAVAAMALMIPLTPLAPAPDADACGKHHYYRRYYSRTTKKKVKDRWEVKVNYYSKYYSFRGGSYRLKEVTLYTKSKQVANFIYKKGTTHDFWKAVKAGAGRYNCKDLLVGKRLVKLEKGLATAVAKYYRKKTKKSAGAIDAMVNMYAPYRAYCNPTKKKYASRP